MPADPARRSVVVGPKAPELRRYVGSTAWVVLEEMLQVATGPAHQLTAEVSVRSLGASLGLSKDTVARAVRRLRDLGVIHAEQQRSANGVFETGRYRLDVPVACLAVHEPTAPATQPTAAPTTNRRTRTNRTTSTSPKTKPSKTTPSKTSPSSRANQLSLSLNP